MFNERYHRDIRFFGAMHVAALLVMAAVLFVVVLFRKSFAESARRDKLFRYLAAGLMTAMEIVFLIWSCIRGNFLDVIPLEMCSILLWTAAFATFFNRPKLLKLTFFPACVGSALPFFVLTAGYVFPHFRFFHYFTVHFMIILLNLYPVVTGRTRFTYRDVLRSSLFTLCAGLFVLPFDYLLPANFMFLRSLPGPLGALSDKMGPWYLLPYAAILFAGYNLIYGVYSLIVGVNKARATRRESRLQS